MFLPFHDDNPTRRRPVVTYGLVAVNVIAFLWFLQLAPAQRYDVTMHFGFVPARIAQLSRPQSVFVPRDATMFHPRLGRVMVRQQVELKPDHGEILFSLVSCMFLHAGWGHLLGNMWFLWLFGNNVEDRLGHVLFLLFYLVGGLVGSACHWVIDPESLMPVIGASGAVAAVLGGYAITWPWARVHTLVFIVIFITVVDLPALAVLGAWFILQLVLLAYGAGGVAFWAHVGGFLAGMAMMPVLGMLLGLNRPTTATRQPRPREIPQDSHDRIIDVQILDDRDTRPRW
ncbi:MAG TPA: rhomboid family intramembrane serine protease [Thermoguttaceae bacterium]|nr:rhomboid family intramembrane serine protease [Thermoguttaceae bacterium]